MARRTPLVVLMVVFALLAGACSAGDDGGGDASPATSSEVGEATRTLTFEDSADALAAVDVVVFEDVESTEPIESPAGGGEPVLGYARWQVENMTAEINDGGGMLGSDLDAAIPLGEGIPPLSYLLAAWVDLAPTSSAELVAEMMGEQDWTRAPEVLFPTMALTLFVADAAAADAADPGVAGSDAGATEGASASMPSGGVPRVALASVGQIGTPCSLVSGFVDRSLNWLFSSLSVTPSGGLGGFLGTVWNTALALAQAAVQGLISTITAPVIGVLRAAIGAVAVVTMVVSYLKPWTLPVDARPPTNRYSIDGSADIKGDFQVKAKIETGRDQWPPTLVDCASALGIALPELTGADAPVEWTVMKSTPDMITVSGTGPPWKGKLDTARTATLDYVTGHEPQDWADNGAEVTSGAWTTAKVERKEVGDLTKLVEGFVYGTLGGATGPAASTVNAIIKPFLDGLLGGARSKLAALLNVQGSTMVRVVHHKAPDPTTTTSSTTPVPVLSGCNPDDPRFETGTWEGTGTISSEFSSGDVMRSTTLTPGTLEFRVTIDEDGNVTEGTWTATGMVVQISAGDRNDTANYAGEGPLTGTGDKLLMGGGYKVEVIGVTTMDVPAGDYPIEPASCKDGKIIGDITPPADAAAAAAGMSGGFLGPYTAEMVG